MKNRWMPCYFEESLGGVKAWSTKIKGDKLILHFAYLVDEDMINGMALEFDGLDTSNQGKTVYLDISQE
jgi:hypothetical protein